MDERPAVEERVVERGELLSARLYELLLEQPTKKRFLLRDRFMDAEDLQPALGELLVEVHVDGLRVALEDDVGLLAGQIAFIVRAQVDGLVGRFDGKLRGVE